MGTEKKYYWIKLKDRMLTSDAVDFLMGQKDGANYIVLYQMLCLETIKTNGILARQIGEITIAYDVDKIQRDCKYFSRDTIVIALDLYQKLGLIEKQENGFYKIIDFENMVGSECESAERVRKFRNKNALQCNEFVTENVTLDKDKDKDKEIIINKNNKESIDINKKIYMPTHEEITDFIEAHGFRTNPNKFENYYKSIILSKGATAPEWTEKLIEWGEAGI